MRVHIDSRIRIRSEALVFLLNNLGHESSHSDPAEMLESDVIIIDLDERSPLYPSPTSKPTLALSCAGFNRDTLSALGYCGVIEPETSTTDLAIMLESACHGLPWVNGIALQV